MKDSTLWNCDSEITDYCNYSVWDALHVIDLQPLGNISELNILKFFRKLCVLLYHDIPKPKYFAIFSDIILALFFPGS